MMSLLLLGRCCRFLHFFLRSCKFLTLCCFTSSDLFRSCSLLWGSWLCCLFRNLFSCDFGCILALLCLFPLATSWLLLNLFGLLLVAAFDCSWLFLGWFQLNSLRVSRRWLEAANSQLFWVGVYCWDEHYMLFWKVLEVINRLLSLERTIDD